jgi:hypothetical protein
LVRIIDTIKSEVGLTDFAAKELLGASNKLSKSYEVLARTYRTNLLTETKELVRRDQEHQRTKNDASLWKKATRAVDRLSGDGKSMWGAYADAVKAHNHFTAVCKAHQLYASYDRLITQIFEIRRNDHDITMGRENVVTGRDAFDTLRREGYLAIHLTAGKITKAIPHVEG